MVCIMDRSIVPINSSGGCLSRVVCEGHRPEACLRALAAINNNLSAVPDCTGDIIYLDVTSGIAKFDHRDKGM